MTAVDRHTRCIVGWEVVWERQQEQLQAVVDQGPRAQHYFSDEWTSYQGLVYYPGRHRFSVGKADTYSVEGDNAEVRHYLARLVRRSRCFSRCIKALRYALRLFVWCWNQRQLYRQRYPNYPAHLIHFVSPPS